MAISQLLDLNDDLIRDITDVLPPKEAISFALCSKRLHALSFSRLKKHQECVKNYSKLYISNTPNAGPGIWAHNHPLSALHALSEDPWLALYPTRLEWNIFYDDIMGGHEDPDEEDDELAEFLDSGPDCIFEASFLTTVQKHEWYYDILGAFYSYHEDDEDQDVDYDSGPCQCGKCMVLLLAQLPNLQHFEMQGTPTWPVGVLQRYIEDVTTGKKKDDNPALSKLKTIFYGSGESMVPMLALVGLPSVRQLYVAKLIEHAPDMSLHVLTHYPPNLTVLGLADTTLSTVVLHAIIDDCPNLQRLTCAFQDADFTFPCGCPTESAEDKDLVQHILGEEHDLVERGFGIHFDHTTDQLYNARVMDVVLEREYVPVSPPLM